MRSNFPSAISNREIQRFTQKGVDSERGERCEIRVSIRRDSQGLVARKRNHDRNLKREGEEPGRERGLGF